MPTKSPFFNPTTPARKTVQVVVTPGGTRRQTTTTQPAEVEEHKSTVIGCSANLINAIVGAGIVGIPYAIQQAGLVAGLVLVLVCSLMTLKSLRLLIHTAQEINTPSYETLCEAAFGHAGFLFIAANMFVMAYGAMVSYLMIVKDTFPIVMGVDPDNLPLKRSILFVLSLLIMVPLSSQRDMADLAKTSRISVCCDILMVLIVVATSPIPASMTKAGGFTTSVLPASTIHGDTIFVGLGVLSFAFVCQHSAFIIAGSLDRPTKRRWRQTTLLALTICACLATTCGVAGYLGFLEGTLGNILNNLQATTLSANIARGLLGSTMLFVYPMESFVARHVLVVTLFRGRRAHEGDDAAILNRRDRRLALTLGLYILALVPALCFENLGNVLSVTGAIGGSCLSYIGPGVCYLGVYGKEFLVLAREWRRRQGGGRHYHQVEDDEEKETELAPPSTTKEELKPLTMVDTKATTLPKPLAAAVTSSTPVLADEEAGVEEDDQSSWSCGSAITSMIQTVTWYLCLMPLWTYIAYIGKAGMERYQHELATKSPHLSRIAAKPTPKVSHARRPVHAPLSIMRKGSMQETPLPLQTGSMRDMREVLKHTESLPAVVREELPPSSYQKASAPTKQVVVVPPAALSPPEPHIPTPVDFVIAIGYMLFGVVAMSAGLVSIFYEAEGAARR